MINWPNNYLHAFMYLPMFTKGQHLRLAMAKIVSSQAHYADNKESMCAKRRGRYALAEPKSDMKDMYLKEIQANLLGNSEAWVQLMKAFKKQHETLVKRTHRVVGKTACKLAASRLLNKALQTRKEQAGSLLKTTRPIQSLQIRGSEGFGEGCHTAASEPYDYNSAYQLVSLSRGHMHTH